MIQSIMHKHVHGVLLLKKGVLSVSHGLVGCGAPDMGWCMGSAHSGLWPWFGAAVWCPRGGPTGRLAHCGGMLTTGGYLGVPQHFKGGGGGFELAHEWANWLHKHFCLGGPQCFKAADKISIAPQVGGSTA